MRRPIIDRLEDRRLFAVAPGFAESVFATGLTFPTAFAFAPDGRLFVAQQNGQLRVIRDGGLLPDAAIDLEVNSQGERGLLGVAFDPAFAQNGLIYLHYTAETPAVHNRVSRFTVVGDSIDPSTEQVLIDLPNLGPTNHNGGAIHFGADGKLYIAVGDNGEAFNAQPLTSVMGKILRLNADGAIPVDNPFFAETTGQNQAIWARGLRNPYTFAFRSDGRMHINDVGQSSFEEINVGDAGANYGWPIIEGKRTDQTPPADYVDPLFAYSRSGGAVSGTVIAGGAFYESPAGATESFPAAMEGDYLFADLGSGFVKSIDVTTREVSSVATLSGGPVDLAVGPDGAVYVLEYVAGRVTRVTSAQPDLAVTFVRAPSAEALETSRQRVKVRIENVGEVTARGPVAVRLHASADGVVDSQDTLLRTRSRMVSLKPGRAMEVALPFRYPAGLTGSFTLLAELSGEDERIAEVELANNLAASPVQISAPFADLSPTFRSSSILLSPQRWQRVVIDVHNLGNVGFIGRLEVTLAVTPQGGGDATTLLQRTVSRVIAADGQRRVALRISSPEGLAAGGYDLTATVMPTDPLADTQLQNNGITIPATVTA